MKDIGDSGDYFAETKLFQDCPLAQCIYNQIMSTNTATNCGLIDPLELSDNFGVVFNIEHNLGASGTTEYSKQFNIATINIDLTAMVKNLVQI